MQIYNDDDDDEWWQFRIESTVDNEEKTVEYGCFRKKTGKQKFSSSSLHIQDPFFLSG